MSTLLVAVVLVVIGVLLLIRHAYLNNDSVEAGFNCTFFGFTFKTINNRKRPRQGLKKNLTARGTIVGLD